MKNFLKFWIAALIAVVFLWGCSQSSQKQYDVSTISAPDYMHKRGKEHFAMRLPDIDAQPVLQGGVLLAGDSITEGWLRQDVDLGVPVSNHGIGWDTVTGLQSRLPQMLRHNPDKIFILIGTNDIGYHRDINVMADELKTIIQTFQLKKPKAKIYIQSVMPREAQALPMVRDFNASYKNLAEVQGVNYIDLTPVFAAPNGILKPELTDDGLHLNTQGYEKWASVLEDYIQN